MKVLLLQDVYNLGRAGDIKKVANGYGRNYLIPQGMAVLATPGSLKQAERIREKADMRRAILNEELAGVAEALKGMQLLFPARAGETGKLYGSVTTQMIAEELTQKLDVEITKRMVDSQPLRLLGMHTVNIRLTIDLIPHISVVIYREGEPPENYMVAAEELASQAEEELVVEEEAAEVDEPEVSEAAQKGKKTKKASE
jgi:large subunit ribosomal protein L9